jgi:hypothetical protein
LSRGDDPIAQVYLEALSITIGKRYYGLVSWSRRFGEPILLPDGRKLKTLAETMAWLAKEIPKSEHKMEKVQTAAHCVTQAAEHGGPMIFAQMGMLQAIHCHQKRELNPDAKDHHWGKRKLKRDQ